MTEKAHRDVLTLGLPVLLTTEEVAAALHVDKSTLSRWRTSGRGPRVLWLSRGIPRYLAKDVQDWLERTGS
jgi:hypothetical protein